MRHIVKKLWLAEEKKLKEQQEKEREEAQDGDNGDDGRISSENGESDGENTLVE